jgi:Zn-dependent M28 family amino/carboxypeptidase
VSLADPALSETSGMEVALSFTARGADKLFAGSGHTFAEIQALVRDNKPLPHFPLNGTLRSQAVLKHDALDSPNVVGMVPGHGKLKNEYVILSAHLDHVGVGRAVNGDTIYNGAMDDGSGIATVLEVARLLKESKARLKRSVIFLLVTAEEKGELGSQYYAAHPTVPFKNIVADINLDMFLPLYPLKVIEVQGLMESTLGESVKAAAEVDGVQVQIDQEPAENRFIRSDQYSFIRRGIPSLAFKFGYQPGSPDETTRKNWVRDRYHKPSDDLTQPVDTAAAAKFDRIILRLMETVANDPARPQWHQDSFFRRFALPSNP